jgi:hypothetical protein
MSTRSTGTGLGLKLKIGIAGTVIVEWARRAGGRAGGDTLCSSLANEYVVMRAEGYNDTMGECLTVHHSICSFGVKFKEKRALRCIRCATLNIGYACG